MKKIIALIGTIVGIIGVVVMCFFVSAAIHHAKMPYDYLTGKDTILAVGDGRFQISKLPDFIGLTFDDGNVNNEEYDLLSKVIHYQEKEGFLYVTSEEGYAVVDEKHNTAQVLVTVKKQFYDSTASGVSNITYLTSYNQFSKQDRKILDNLHK